MIVQEEDYNNFLMHYGTPRKSGRYPYGSGEQPRQSGHKEFLDYVADMRKQGLSDQEVYEGLGINSTQFRNYKTLAKAKLKEDRIHEINKLADKGVSGAEIGRRLGIPEPTVRALRNPANQEKANILKATSDALRTQVDEKGAIDIGAGVEHHVIGVTRTKLNQSVAMLEQEGYEVHYVPVTQVGTGKQTTIKVLRHPDDGPTWTNMMKDPTLIGTVTTHTEDHGRTWDKIEPPLNLSSKRVAINYKENGGDKADGLIYVRPGKDDVSLGGKQYAQVRIGVDGTHYIKGMAVYKHDLPEGVDVVFNTNKRNTGNKLDALKEQSKDDPTNPFGASLKRQVTAPDGKGGKKVTSVMNIVNEEGSWDSWSRSLSSQTLSKQSPMLAKQQLDLVHAKKAAGLAEIKSLTNPTVRKKLLETYAESVDASAVQLQAHRLPRASWHAILPFNSMKPNEIYAPNFRDGEKVALIRFPHGGTFEIPELTVNNRGRIPRSIIGRAVDAVGIHHTVANRLSGADFDGDAVLVIPNNSNRIKTTSPLEKLKGFDPQASYKLPNGQKFSGNKQHLMGDVSNLITDMTIRGANTDEIARAVKHSMVVIDAEKHDLDHRRSAADNGIAALKKKYQSDPHNPRARGASTLISKATSETRVAERKPHPAGPGIKNGIDMATGKKVYVETGATYVNKKGKTVLKTVPSVKLAETHDAHTLSSGSKIESVYADHSNRLKALANAARKEAVNTPNMTTNSKARQVYASQVKRLDAKLALAQRNAPLERHAQVLANGGIAAKIAANPGMDSDRLKKVRFQELEKARGRVGAKKEKIHIDDDEWEAIQAGAITNNKLKNILDNADLDRVKELATPRKNTVMSPAKMARASVMLNAGYTQAEVAAALGVPVSTLSSSVARE